MVKKSTSFTEETKRNLSITKDIHKQLIERSEKIKTRSQIKTLILAYYKTFLDITNSCLLLFQEKQMTSVPIVLRLMLEILVILLNLIKDTKFFPIFLRIQALDEAIKINTLLGKDSKSMTDQKNNLFMALKNNKNMFLFKTKNKITDKLQPLKYLFLNVLAEDSYLYYEYLCLDTHQNLLAIYEKHFPKKYGTNDLTDKEKHKGYSEMILRLLFQTAKHVHTIMKNAPKFISKLENIVVVEMKINPIPLAP